MWIESWNQAEVGVRLYYSDSGDNGYYLEGNDNQIVNDAYFGHYNNYLYFPAYDTDNPIQNGYYLSSPSNRSIVSVSCAWGDGRISFSYGGSYPSLRPIVHLKSDVTAKQDTNGVWKLQ